MFLPSGDETNNNTLTLMVTVKNEHTTVDTTVAAQVSGQALILPKKDQRLEKLKL